MSETVNIPRESTQQRIAQALEKQNTLLSVLAGEKESSLPMTWEDWQRAVRTGEARKLLKPGDQFTVMRVKEAVISASGSIQNPKVDAVQFVKGRGEVREGRYLFRYDGTDWLYGKKIQDMQSLGITYEGIPERGDELLVKETAEPLILDVAGFDYDVPADGKWKHSLTLVSHDCVYTERYNLPELMWFCDGAAFPEGLVPGTYHLTLSHSGYGGNTGQDGDYEFTIQKPIRPGGGIRHSVMGKYQDRGYEKQQILDGRFSAYDPRGNLQETGIATRCGSTGPSLGTATASDPQYRKGAGMGFLVSQYYGLADWENSAVRQWLNSDRSVSWHVRKTPWNLLSASPAAGFLHGLDPAFLKAVGRVRKRTLCCKPGQGTGVKDLEEKVFLLSSSEVGLGSNIGVWETPLTEEGPRQTSYALYQGDQDRIYTWQKINTQWWHRGCSREHMEHLLTGGTDGKSCTSHAAHPCGVVPGFCIV